MTHLATHHNIAKNDEQNDREDEYFGQPLVVFAPQHGDIEGLRCSRDREIVALRFPPLVRLIPRFGRHESDSHARLPERVAVNGECGL